MTMSNCDLRIWVLITCLLPLVSGNNATTTLRDLTLDNNSKNNNSSTASATIITTTTTTEPDTSDLDPISSLLPPFLPLTNELWSGPILIINNNTFLITALHFNATHDDCYIWTGNGTQPSSNGFPLLDETGSNASLSNNYTGQNLTVVLPRPVTVDRIGYLSVWCVDTNQSLGHVATSTNRSSTNHLIKHRALEPYGVHLNPFSRLAHGLRSGPVVVIDKRTFFIPNLHYDGKGPDAHFWVGTGKEPSVNGIAVPDENGSTKSISSYTGQNIYIRLPDGLTVDDIDYLGVWCVEYRQNFGHVVIPKGLNVPDVTDNPPNLTGDNKMIVWLQKCCPFNKILTQSGCKDNVNRFQPVIDVHVHNLTHLEEEPLAADMIQFEPFVDQLLCPYDKYPLDPLDDEFSLLQNGSLLIKTFQKIVSQDEYCMESIEFQTDNGSEWVTTAIVCYTRDDQPTSNTMFAIYAFGVFVSSLFLFVTAGVFLAVKEVRDARGKCVVGYSVSMAIAFVCLAAAQLFGVGDEGCSVLGFFVQFFLVSSFTWLSTISWETYFKIRKYDSDEYTSDKHRLYIYLAVGICIPVLVLLISLIIDRVPDIPNTFLKPQFGRNTCWFDHKQISTLYFYMPIAVSILFNLTVAGLMKYKLVWLQNHKSTDVAWNTVKQELKPMYRSCFFLLAIMTLCWIMEILSFSFKSDSGFWIAIDIINSLQGVIVFLVFVLHRPVNLVLKRWWMRIKKTREPSKTEEAVPMNGMKDPSFFTNLKRCDSTEQIS